MSWHIEFPQNRKPSMEQINEYINSPIWLELCEFLDNVYHVVPQIEYSKCSAAPGWNIKYKKGGRSLCTIYPREEYFTCLVTVGKKETIAVEKLLPTLSDSIQERYREVTPMNGARWLMIDVLTEEILQEVKNLIKIRVPDPKK